MSVKRVVVMIEDANDFQSSRLIPILVQIGALAGCRYIDVVYPDDPSFVQYTNDIDGMDNISFALDLGGLPNAPDAADRIAVAVNAVAKLVGLPTPPTVYEDDGSDYDDAGDLDDWDYSDSGDDPDTLSDPVCQ